ncbi:hypothetical protein [Mesorhizobium sp. B2-4-6]|uniref:hypothetical protein n=1 Tax=Mesorhizobium sp. B2-4-6 TaxID=2589943 RepID=UPI00112A1F34|nr:hypothetical protein [Mesorhizobium sp. B2-4-6]TPL45330.1 hypothetical protein FJ957_20690 [Mesorhizobium sp. B2-4-6]
MTDAPIFSICLQWQRLPGSPLLAVRADGVADAQVRHYGRRAGLHRVAIDDEIPAMVGTTEQRDALLCELENAGYEIEEHM